MLDIPNEISFFRCRIYLLCGEWEGLDQWTLLAVRVVHYVLVLSGVILIGIFRCVDRIVAAIKMEDLFQNADPRARAQPDVDPPCIIQIN